MKIALVAPLVEPVPPPLYGGTERVVAHLGEALVSLGHDVTLFASGDTWTSARLVAARERALRLDPAPALLKSELAANLTMLHLVRERADEFDVIHFHIDLVHFPFFEHIASRTLTTLHGRLDISDLPEVYRRWRQYPLVSISNAQRRPLPRANWLATVHHGIPMDRFGFSSASEGYLAFLGRISPEKQPDCAIEIARRAGMPLKIAAKVDPVDASYYAAKIEPLIKSSSHVEYLGELGDQQKNELLGGATALLFPIAWPEPFGLVMIESMACGTPVIAFDCGAVAEVVDPGTTGVVVHSIDEAAEAVRRIDTLDRRQIRATFERRFSSLTMGRSYLRLYEHLSTPARRDIAIRGA